MPPSSFSVSSPLCLPSRFLLPLTVAFVGFVFGLVCLVICLMAGAAGIGLGVIEIDATLLAHATLLELAAFHDDAEFELLVLGVYPDADRADGVSRIRAVLVFRLIYVLADDCCSRGRRAGYIWLVYYVITAVELFQILDKRRRRLAFRRADESKSRTIQWCIELPEIDEIY